MYSTFDPKLFKANWDDASLQLSMIEAFEEDYLTMMNDIESALGGDKATLSKATHSFKGTLAYFAAPTATKLITEMDQCAVNGDMDRVSELFPELKQKVDQLATELQQFKATL